MKTSGISQFNALPKRQQEIKLMVEHARQSFNSRNIAPYKIPAAKSELGQYLEQRVQGERLWSNVIKRVTGKNKWPKLV